MQRTKTQCLKKTVLILSIVSIVSAITVPSVNLPSSTIGNNVMSSGTSVSWYDNPVCYECVPEPTPAPVYETVGLSISPLSIKTKENRMVTLQANQISGKTVLSTASWQWSVQNPRGYGTLYTGQVISFKILPGNFGKWQIILNVRDSVQMLNGHLSTSVNIVKK